MIIFSGESGHNDPELDQLHSGKRCYGTPADSRIPLQIVSHPQITFDLRGFCMRAVGLDELHRAGTQDLHGSRILSLFLLVLDVRIHPGISTALRNLGNLQAGVAGLRRHQNVRVANPIRRRCDNVFVDRLLRNPKRTSSGQAGSNFPKNN
jgi:hypothetical protein